MGTKSCLDVVFNPTPERIATLTKIGFTEEHVKDGRITCEEAIIDTRKANIFQLLDPVKVLHSVLKPSFLSTGERSINNEIDFFEAMLTGQAKSLLLALFRQNQCPGSATTAPYIFSALTSIHSTSQWWGIDTEKEVERQCSATDMARDSNFPLRTIYFIPGLTPPKIAKAAQAIVQIRLGGEEMGTGIIVSQDGTVESARHVFYNRKGKFRNRHPGDGFVFVNNAKCKVWSVKDLWPGAKRNPCIMPMKSIPADFTLTFRGVDYPIDPASIEIFKDQDRVRFKVVDLGRIQDLPTAKIASRFPTEGDRLWHGGFANAYVKRSPMSSSIDFISTPGNSFRPAKSEVVFGTGLITGWASGKMLLSTGRIIPGMSGGPAFNVEGDLVGINVIVFKNDELDELMGRSLIEPVIR